MNTDIQFLHDLDAEFVGLAGRAERRRSLPRVRRLPLVRLSAGVAAAAVVAAVVGSLTLGGASPQSAYAAARKALAATSAQRSGAVTVTVNGTTLYTEHWNGSRTALKKGQSSPLVLGHVLGPNRQMVLMGGGAYVQGSDGMWTHYASEADLGDKLGPAPYFLRANIRGNTAREILSVATNLHRSSGPDGSTIYTGTIRNAHVDPKTSLGQDEVTGMIAKLRGGGASDPDAPAGTYPNRSQLTMAVGRDGLVKRLSFMFRQPSCRPGVPNCPQEVQPTSPHRAITWSVRYSHLGDNRPITAPATFTSTSK